MNYSAREIDNIKKENYELREWSATLQKSIDDYQKICDQLNSEREALHSWADQQNDAISWLKAQNQSLREHQRIQGEFYINTDGFKHIVSLGYNCEVSFRIGQYLGKKVESYPFTWVYIKDQNDYPAILEHIRDLPDDKKSYNPVSGMFHSETLNVDVHTTVPHGNYEELPEEKKSEFEERALEEIRSRFNHLVDKWEALLQGEESVLFIFKCQSWLSDEQLEQIIKDLELYFEKSFASGTYFILVVSDRDSTFHYLSRIDNLHIGIAEVESFAPDSDTEHGGDIEGWRRAIEHFNHIWDKRDRLLTR